MWRGNVDEKNMRLEMKTFPQKGFERKIIQFKKFFLPAADYFLKI
jgi:hypothetical protein